MPVIVITTESHTLRPEDLGVAAFLPKPFAVDELVLRVMDLLAVPAQARAAAGREP